MILATIVMLYATIDFTITHFRLKRECQHNVAATDRDGAIVYGLLFAISLAGTILLYTKCN